MTQLSRLLAGTALLAALAVPAHAQPMGGDVIVVQPAPGQPAMEDLMMGDPMMGGQTAAAPDGDAQQLQLAGQPPAVDVQRRNPKTPYVAFNLGLDYTEGGDVDNLVGDVDRDTGYYTSLAGGYDYGALRGELELGWANADTTGDGDVRSVLGMANLYYDFITPSKFTPWVGAGVGAAWVDVDANVGGTVGRIDDDSVEFAWQLMAGVDYSVNRNWDVYGGYRYLRISSPDVGTVELENFEDHIIQAGVRYRF